MKGLLVKACTFSVFWILLGLIGGLRSDDTYCFRFTWMGPSFNNDTYMNSSSSCADVYDNCRDPMLITYDGTTPDFDDLWKKYELQKTVVACPMTVSSVCAKWTSYYDGKVEYTMHTCSRITVEGEGTMTSGCVTSTTNNSRWTEVCACRSLPDDKPCNAGSKTAITVCRLLVVIFLALKSVM